MSGLVRTLHFPASAVERRSGTHETNGYRGTKLPYRVQGGPAAQRSFYRTQVPIRVETAAFAPLIVRPLPLWKRCMDIVGASIGVLILMPVLAVIALAIKLSSEGPVLFRQSRGGLNGKPFTIFKFRTMIVGAEAQEAALRAFNERKGPAFKMKEDPRVTKVGHFLRRTSLDELPQLFNVLRGEMSLVGPRPLPVTQEMGYAKWHKRRLDVKPGLTCIWQVTSRDDSDFDNWMRLDIRYVNNLSLLLDLKLLFQTFPAVLSGRGAH